MRRDCDGSAAYCGDLVWFAPARGPGYEDLLLDDEVAVPDSTSYTRRDLMMLIEYAAAKVACLRGGVTVYPPDADGDAAPSRVIDVQLPVQLAVSAAGDFFVVVQNGGVFHVPPGDTTSDRNFLPVTTGGNPFLALDDTGDVILSAQGTIATYAATATGNGTPLRSFTLQVSEDIAPALAFVGGAIAVTAQTGEILVFDENTTGNATPTSTLAPAEIVHAKAGMSLAVDASTGSPVFYVGDAQLTTLFEVPATGSGANLVAGVVRSLTVPKEMGGIAVVP